MISSLITLLHTLKTVSLCRQLSLLSLNCTLDIFKEHRDTGIKYKSRVRSRVSNLGDLKNPTLREKVICGDVPPARIATMTTEVCMLYH